MISASNTVPSDNPDAICSLDRKTTDECEASGNYLILASPVFTGAETSMVWRAMTLHTIASLLLPQFASTRCEGKLISTSVPSFGVDVIEKLALLASTIALVSGRPKPVPSPRTRLLDADT